jgi:hypothetical protein
MRTLKSSRVAIFERDFSLVVSETSISVLCRSSPNGLLCLKHYSSYACTVTVVDKR